MMYTEIHDTTPPRFPKSEESFGKLEKANCSLRSTAWAAEGEVGEALGIR